MQASTPLRHFIEVPGRHCPREWGLLHCPLTCWPGRRQGRGRSLHPGRSPARPWASLLQRGHGKEQVLAFLMKIISQLYHTLGKDDTTHQAALQGPEG